jgi:hypothetical protein
MRTRHLAAMAALLVIALCSPLWPSGTGVAAAHVSPAIVVTRLETLPVTDDDGSSMLSPTAPGLSGPDRLGRGILLISHPCAAYASFAFDRPYEWLTGLAYLDNRSPSPKNVFDIDDSTTPPVRTFFHSVIYRDGHIAFAVRVHGLRAITVKVNGCDQATVDVVADLSTGPLPQMGVTADYPLDEVAVPIESTVLFSWEPFPGAVAYIIHGWLVGLDGGEHVSPATPLTWSAAVYGHTLYRWHDEGFAAGQYEYALLPLDAAGHPLAPWSTPVTIILR